MEKEITTITDPAKLSELSETSDDLALEVNFRCKTLIEEAFGEFPFKQDKNCLWLYQNIVLPTKALEEKINEASAFWALSFMIHTYGKYPEFRESNPLLVAIEYSDEVYFEWLFKRVFANGVEDTAELDNVLSDVNEQITNYNGFLNCDGNISAQIVRYSVNEPELLEAFVKLCPSLLKEPHNLFYPVSQYGTTEQLRFLIKQHQEIFEKDPDLSFDDCFLIHYAAKAGNTQIVKELNSYGLKYIESRLNPKMGDPREIDKVTQRINLADKYGDTPLYNAIEKGRAYTVDYLLREGASIWSTAGYGKGLKCGLSLAVSYKRPVEVVRATLLHSRSNNISLHVKCNEDQNEFVADAIEGVNDAALCELINFRADITLVSIQGLLKKQQFSDGDTFIERMQTKIKENTLTYPEASALRKLSDIYFKILESEQNVCKIMRREMPAEFGDGNQKIFKEFGDIKLRQSFGSLKQLCAISIVCNPEGAGLEKLKNTAIDEAEVFYEDLHPVLPEAKSDDNTHNGGQNNNNINGM